MFRLNKTCTLLSCNQAYICYIAFGKTRPSTGSSKPADICFELQNYVEKEATDELMA